MMSVGSLQLHAGDGPSSRSTAASALLAHKQWKHQGNTHTHTQKQGGTQEVDWGARPEALVRASALVGVMLVSIPPVGDLSDSRLSIDSLPHLCVCRFSDLMAQFLSPDYDEARYMATTMAQVSGSGDMTNGARLICTLYHSVCRVSCSSSCFSLLSHLLPSSSVLFYLPRSTLFPPCRDQ